MIDVMPGTDFDQRSQRFLAALRMAAWFCELIGSQRSDERQVPITQRRKRRKRLPGIVSIVVAGPQILIERLHGVIVKRESLTVAKTEGQIAICQMSDDLPRAPLSRRDRLIDSRRADCS